jgi:pimeloyl-ACP methyl ester carboxylesterase
MATAILVHGAWSSPADWRWVAACLQEQGIATVTPDLPSHRSRWADRSDDVREVEEAIHAAAPPVVVAGWSYGGGVLSDLADTGGAGRLVYVASIPGPVEAGSAQEPADLESFPHLLFPDEETLVLDNDWWLATPEVKAFPAEVIDHLHEHPRRPITKSAVRAPPVREAWRTVPATILLGRSDSLMTDEELEYARAHFGDVRVVEGDHFLLLLQPELVAGVIAETSMTAS